MFLLREVIDDPKLSLLLRKSIPLIVTVLLERLLSGPQEVQIACCMALEMMIAQWSHVLIDLGLSKILMTQFSSPVRTHVLSLHRELASVGHTLDITPVMINFSFNDLTQAAFSLQIMN